MLEVSNFKPFQVVSYPSAPPMAKTEEADRTSVLGIETAGKEEGGPQ